MTRFSLLNIKLICCTMVVVLFLSSCKKEKNDSAIPNLPVFSWKYGDDIIITEDLYIDSVNFIIDPGVTVRIKSGCSIIIGDNYPASLMFKGTEDNPINFITYNPEGIPEKSYWGCINIKSSYKEGSISVFEYCNFIKGGGQGYESVIINQTKSLSMVNCVIDYSYNYGILSENYGEFAEFSGNTIKHTLNHPISISARRAHTIGVNNIISTDSLTHGILLSNGRVDLNADTILWHAHTIPYILPDGLSINGNSSFSSFFTIEQGSVLMLGKDKTITIDEDVKFTAAGQLEKPVIFTSSAKEPQPGDWKFIGFYDETDADFNYCIFEYGGKYEDFMADNGMIRLYNATNISMEDCIFRYSESPAILLYKSAVNLPAPMFASFKNNSFENLEDCAISLSPEAVNSIDITNNFNHYYIYVQGTTIESGHIIWKDFGTDYLIDSYVTINGEFETILEIEAGCVIKIDRGGFKVGTASSYGGILIADGTQEKPIVFTSAKENPYYGDWGGILFYTNSQNGCLLNHCEVLYAGECESNGKKASVHISGNGTNVSVTNSIFAHSSHYGLIASGSTSPFLFNNTFFDNLEGE